jgi:ribonuclease R
MRQLVGETFVGVVSGISEWGFYVEESATKAEGLVRMHALTDDYYELDAKNYRLIGKRVKKRYALGDCIRVRLVGADLERRTLDFVPA